ncbi:MAG TPA: LamG-like jellyroll fold domain-containing protein [Planctomycetota bacterium]|jgi:hypothetical protein|nr:LamG-like jellyroll fold domain-containing protein [Planctomycetota bacterium]
MIPRTVRLSGLVAIALLSGTAPAALQSFAAPNLVAYYRLDETSVGTVDDAVGTFDGTHVSNPAPNTTDKAPLLFSNAASLGFTNSLDRVSLPHSLVNGRTNLTVAWWMKTSKTGNQAIVSGATAAQSNSFLLFFVNNTTYRHHENGATADLTVPSISDNAWHHVAVVRDDAANLVTVYTDGVNRGSLSINFGAIAVDPNGLVLGEEQDSVDGGYDANQSFVGLLDDVRFYDRLLSGSEVDYLARGNGPPPAPSLSSAVGATDPVTGAPRVDLNWAAVTTTPATPIVYSVLRSTVSGGPYTTLASNLSGTTYTDTSVTLGTTYYYVVRATNVGGESANSNEQSATPQLPPPRTNDHEEGLVDSRCSCGTARGVPGAGAAALLGAAGILFALLRRR